MKIRPMVQKKNRRVREGKGFSKDELKDAAIGFKQAHKLNILVDSRRKTKHKDNVRTLKQYLQSLKTSTPRKKPKSHRV